MMAGSHRPAVREGYRRAVEGAALVQVFEAVATAVRAALDDLADWGRVPDTPSQYRHDLVADDVAVPLLLDAGLGVLSEESGRHHTDRPVVAVLDPVDGSTNASIGLPWFATSIAAVDADGLAASLVCNQALGVTYTAVRGGGAFRDGQAIAASSCRRLEDAIVVVNDLPPRLGARQFRVYGAAALDLCAVADGTFDGFVDCGVGLAPWDHLGAIHVCIEAGAAVGTLDDAPLLDLDGDRRQRVVAGSCPEVRDALRLAALGDAGRAAPIGG
jgi:myo-inositol-1(or 4)-monophosphatase